MHNRLKLGNDYYSLELCKPVQLLETWEIPNPEASCGHDARAKVRIKGTNDIVEVNAHKLRRL